MPLTHYSICISTAGATIAWPPARKLSRTSAIEATLTLPHVTASANDLIEIPVRHVVVQVSHPSGTVA